MTRMRLLRLRLIALVALLPMCARATVTFNVNDTADHPDDIHDGVCADAFGKCTLRAAIMEANQGATYDVHIVLPAGTYTLMRGVTNPDDDSNGDLDIGAHDVQVTGAGASKTIIDANHVDRAFWVSAYGKLDLYDLTIRNGLPSSVGGRSTRGGAILVHGELFMSGCVLDSNTASDGGALAAEPGSATPSVTVLKTTLNGNIAGYDGGAFYAYQTDAYFDACTLSVNTAQNGAGIRQQAGTLDMQNSTLSSNDASTSGGGVYLYDMSAHFSNVTFAGNGADSDTDSDGLGGGMYLDAATAAVSNSIFDNVNYNTRENDDCYTNLSNLSFPGENIVRSLGGCSFTTGSVTITDPLLGPLKDNGGPTKTAMPSSPGPAFNTGGGGCLASIGVPLTSDQRGVKRPIGAKCDLGAVEIEPIGDANGDGVVNVADVFYVLNFLFAGGPAPLGRANVNGGSVIDVADVFYLINFLFAGGPAPV
jgi:hypothetical protein